MLLALTKYRNANPIALSIYNKAVTWWECSQAAGTNTFIDEVNLHGDGRYNFNPAAATSGVTYQTATLRSGGTASVTIAQTSSGMPMAGASLIPEVSGAVNASITGWVNLGSALSSVFRFLIASFNLVAAGTSGANGQLEFSINSDIARLLWKFSAANTTANVDSTLTLTEGTTYFLGASRDATALTVAHYTNGALTNSGSYTNNADGGASEVFVLGQRYTGTVLGLGGSAQGVAIFKDILTATEHAYLYNGGVGRSWTQIKTAAGH